MKIYSIFILILIPVLGFSQFEVLPNGTLKLNTISNDNSVQELVARQTDGTIVTRNISSLPSSSLTVITEDVVNNRIGIRNTVPEFTLDVVHANGTPAAGSADPHNGLNIRHEGANNNQWTLYVSNGTGALSFYHNAIKEIEFTTDGSVNFLSDKNAKKEIIELNKGINAVMALKPSQYKYKDSNTGKLCYGFIAQELAEVFPNLVSVTPENKGDTYAVDYVGLIPVLTKSIQEQQLLLEAQAIEIAKLKELVEAMR